jgi:hypothetical protein
LSSVRHAAQAASGRALDDSQRFGSAVGRCEHARRTAADSVELGIGRVELRLGDEGRHAAALELGVRDVRTLNVAVKDLAQPARRAVAVGLRAARFVGHGR